MTSGKLETLIEACGTGLKSLTQGTTLWYATPTDDKYLTVVRATPLEAVRTLYLALQDNK